ncbi:hypothetical protein N9H09_01110 [bacterium]|nr:hypothetical protein [bacterium]
MRAQLNYAGNPTMTSRFRTEKDSLPGKTKNPAGITPDGVDIEY